MYFQLLKGNKMAFDNKKFKATMRVKGITQKALAESLGKTERTINDWLSTSHKLKAEEVDRLCQSIGEEPTEFDPDWVGSVDTSHKARVSANVSSAVKNGFWLLKKRYGVSEKDVIELAPTLFSIVVEHARQAPHDYWDKWERHAEHSKKLGFIPDQAFDESQRANYEIDILLEDKIFGKNNELEAERRTGRPPENLFQGALIGMCEKYNNISVGGHKSAGECPDAAHNVIDRDFVNAIVDGDEDLAKAISAGDIELFSKEFESFSDTKKRLDWMKKSYAKILEERKKRHEEWLDELIIKDPDLYQRLTETWEERERRWQLEREEKREKLRRRRYGLSQDAEPELEEGNQ
jgi:transcriptional regulator with XRE-family HTH domain